MRRPSAAPAIALAILLAQGCTAETRGWVLWERAPETPGLDAGCADCTYRFALGSLAITTEHGGTDGSSHVDACPADGALVGYAGTLQQVSVEINGTSSSITVVGSLRGTCASVAISAGGELAITPTAEQLPTRGDAASPPTWWQTCPEGEVVVGYDGRAGIFLDQVSFVCARAAIAQSASGPRMTTSAEHRLQPAGGDGGSPFNEHCGADQIAHGQSLRSDQWINSFALVCGTPSFVVAPRTDGG